MRSKVLKSLADALFVALRADWPEIAKLDPKREEFNGTVGFRLGTHCGRHLFLTLTPHESEESFRCGLAWSTEPRYPAHPFMDLRLDLREHWRHEAAEIQVADLAPDSVPYEFELDPGGSEAKKRQQLIAARLAAGEPVSEEEWLATLTARCSLDEAVAQAQEAASTIAQALKQNVGVLER
jgi:hypothetical protein